jgi:hypothetical protein
MTAVVVAMRPLPSAAGGAVVDLSAHFGRLLLDSPLMRQLDRGDTLWGDLDLYFPEAMAVEPRRMPLSACFDLEKEDQEPALLSGAVGGERRVTAAPPEPRVDVPPFVVGIKTLIVRNLPRDITVDTVRAAFGRHGTVRDVYIPKNMDRNSPHFGTVKGFALVKFATPEESAAAYQAEWGRLQFGKNKITVEFAQADR